MLIRLLDFLVCPACQGSLHLEDLSSAGIDPDSHDPSAEISLGLLNCPSQHWYPIVGGIPRMLPDSLADHWRTIAGLIERSPRDEVRTLGRLVSGPVQDYDTGTRANFSLEWDQHEVGDRTWMMTLDDRVQWFFIDPIQIPKDELVGKVVLDAGCGNGSQAVAYTEFGLEVVAIDLSTGVDKGQAFRHRRPAARPDKVHFVQGDLQHPPLSPGSFDIIHSAGVLQATPNTKETFHRLCPLLKPGGTFYVWVLKYERIVTPVVNMLRAVTTRVPSHAFDRIAAVLAQPFRGFCWALNALGIRRYGSMTVREARLALMDIFGAPYAHYHSYDEVAAWFRSEGFVSVWPCNDDRRGFGACGRLGCDAGLFEPGVARSASAPRAEVA